MQPDPVSTSRDHRWGTDCPVHTLRHWCDLCRRGETGHATSHTCACGAVDASPIDRMVEWYRAQLDEDERLAKAAVIPAHDGPNAYKPHPELAAWRYEPDGEVEYVSTPEMRRHEYADTYYVTCDGEGCTPAVDERVGPHIARNDPDRVLRRVAADRAILRLWEAASGDEAARPYMDSVIRNLVAGYAGRDGYDERWGPA